MPFVTFILLVISSLAASAQEPVLVVVEKKASQVGFYTSEGERVAGVAVGETPHEMVLDPDGRHLYVSDNGVLWMSYEGPGGNSVSIVDIKERKKVGVISTGKFHRPHGMTIDPRTNRMIVTSENPDRLVLVDLKSRAVIQDFDNGGEAPHMVMFGPQAEWVYASNTRSDTLGAVNLNTGETKVIPIGDYPQGSALSGDGKHLYATCSDSATIHIIDTATQQQVGVIEAGKGVNRVVITPDQKTLVYSIGSEGKAVGFADIATRKQTGKVDLGGSPLSISLSKDGKHAFAGVQDNDEIWVVSVDGRKVVQVIKTPEGAGPDPVMAIGPYQPPK
jgi:DNA-binding beta-propeller fold protein YncE